MKNKFPAFLMTVVMAFLFSAANVALAAREPPVLPSDMREPEDIFAASLDMREPEEIFAEETTREKDNMDTTPIQTDEPAPNQYEDVETPLSPNAAEKSRFEVLSYSFANKPDDFQYPPNYRLPRARYQSLYGNACLAEHLYISDFDGWRGNAYGMAATASIFAGENSVYPSSFHEGAKSVAELLLSDRNPDWNISLTEFIETMQASQTGSLFCAAVSKNMGRLDKLVELVSAYETDGKAPVTLLLFDGATGEEYALIPYRMETDDSTAIIRLYVYDPAFPLDDSRCLTLFGTEESNERHWEYVLINGTIKNGKCNEQLSFLTCQECLSIWNMRGKPDFQSVLLTLNVSDATVRDMEMRPVAVLRDGILIEGNSNVYPVRKSGFPAGLSVWLPTDEVYVISNDNPDMKRLETTLVNVRQQINLETDSRSVVLSVEDITASSYARIPEAEREYALSFIANLPPQYDNLRIQGVTSANASLSVSEAGGVLNISGAGESNRLYLNGEERAVDNFHITPVHSDAALPFTDVSSTQYYYYPVQWAVSENITKGTSITSFSPQQGCSRAHILTFLWRANGSPEPGISNPFSDVNPRSYYAKAAAWAYEKGIATNNPFLGDAPCARADVVTYLWKLSGCPAAGECVFEDVSVNTELSQAVDWAVNFGVTNGTSTTAFSPGSVCTRGQIVTFLYRYYVKSTSDS